MKRAIIASAVLLFGGVGVAAADLGGSKMRSDTAYSDVTASPAWAGWYVGAHVGYGWGEFDATRSMNRSYGSYTKAKCSDPTQATDALCTGTDEYGDTRVWTPREDTLLGSISDVGTGTLGMDGVFGGLDLSYKIKVGTVIFEPFADVSWGGGKDSKSWKNGIDSYVDGDGVSHDVDLGLSETGSVSVEKNWDSTLGLKAGFLVTPSDYLYGLGGLKYGSFSVGGNSRIVTTSTDEDVKTAAGKFPASYSSDEDAWGYTLGAGLEHAVNDHLHVGIEGRYTAYEDIRAGYSKVAEDAANTYATSDQLKGSYDEWSVLGRVSYRFGGN